jgi:sugar phosphate isomerase/epimerase
MRHSLQTVNWVEFEADGGLRPCATLQDVVRAVADAGSENIGLDDVSVGAEGLDDAVALLRANGLTCTDVGVLRVGSGASTPAAEWLARLAERTGARICIAAFTASPHDETVVRELDRAAGIVSAGGARLALEFVPYSPLDSLAATVALCERIGWERCGVLLDSWHFCRSGAPWAELRALGPEQIALVHLSDAPEPVSDDARHESRFRRLPPGAGTLPLSELVATLRELGYSGVVSAEVLSADIRAMPPAAGARLLADALQATWPISPAGDG